MNAIGMFDRRLNLFCRDLIVDWRLLTSYEKPNYLLLDKSSSSR